MVQRSNQPRYGGLRERKSMARNKLGRKGVLWGYLPFHNRKTSAIFPKILPERDFCVKLPPGCKLE